MTPKHTTTVEKGNRLIAEFDGWKVSKSGKTYRKDNYSSPYRLKDIHYHSSWDWLMPIIEKIEELEIGDIGFDIDIHYTVCSIFGGAEQPPYITIAADKKIDAVWRAVVQFIQWYNTQTSKQ